MYKYTCPYCKSNQFSQLSPESTRDFIKYQTSICATAKCHRTGEYYKVLTDVEICGYCEDRLRCLSRPVAIAIPVPKELAGPRFKTTRASWKLLNQIEEVESEK